MFLSVFLLLFSLFLSQSFKKCPHMSHPWPSAAVLEWSLGKLPGSFAVVGGACSGGLNPGSSC